MNGMNPEFSPHQVEWTSEKVQRFWNYFVTNEQLLELAASNTIGDGVIELCSPYLKHDTRILDFGCGGGGLIGKLIEKGFSVEGCDSSEASVETTKRRFNGQQFFKGAFLSGAPVAPSIPDATYDFIFSLEMIEHLLPDEVDATFREFSRILKPGGYLLVSTPNGERLDKYKVICPDCGAIFHRVQHLNSYTPERLSGIGSSAGLVPILNWTGLLTPRGTWIDLLKKGVRRLHWLLPGANKFAPHLIYIGQKQ